MQTAIRNRHDQKLAVRVEQTPTSRNLAFVMHGLGGFKEQPHIRTLAEDHPDRVSALAPLAPLISGQLSYDYKKQHDPAGLQEWETTGWQISPHHSKVGAVKRLPWSHMVNRLRYDVLPRAHNLTMPVGIIVGTADTSCPLEHQQLLMAQLPGPKELQVIDGMPHTPREENHLQRYRAAFSTWLTSHF